MAKQTVSDIRKALETALHELIMVHGLRVTDIPVNCPTWVIDTQAATTLITRTLAELGGPAGNDSLVS